MANTDQTQTKHAPAAEQSKTGMRTRRAFVEDLCRNARRVKNPAHVIAKTDSGHVDRSNSRFKIGIVKRQHFSCREQ